VGVLSGGERNGPSRPRDPQRANLILLDEPTNDLDVNSIRALEGKRWKTLPDARRRLPRPLVSRQGRDPILAFEGDSSVHAFPGNYSAYLEDNRRRKGGELASRTGSSIGNWLGGE